MKWRGYPRHKDSGIEWLGKIPEHWEVIAFKRLGEFQAGAGFPDEEQGLSDEELPFYKVSDTNLEGNEVFMVLHNNSISRETAARLRAFIFPPETIVFAKVGAALLLNKRRMLTGTSCIDNNMMGFMRRDGDLKWLYYWMCGVDLGELANPGAVPSVNEGQLREISVPVPPRDEQRAIAAFLDRETARIDPLIAKKQRQTELLQEKRAALISHAVTKGLNPNVRMKPSGIEWLGEIPEHWEVRRFKFLLPEPLKYGANEVAELDDPSLPRYVRITDINEDGTLREDTFKSLPEDIARPYLLREGDLLFARSGATVGKTFLYQESWGRAAYAGYLIRARLDRKKMLPRFGAYFAWSRNYWNWLRSSFIQATIENVSAEKYANLMLSVPPMDEQTKIIESYIPQFRGGGLRNYPRIISGFGSGVGGRVHLQQVEQLPL